MLDAVQAAGDHAGQREVGVDVAAGHAGSPSAAPAPWPTSRTAQVRLSRPQAIAVGANEPGCEPLVGVDVRRVEQGEARAWCASTPAMNVVVERRARRPSPRPRTPASPSSAAQRQVDVAGVALALVVLRHEGQRLALLGGDLLGAVLVDDVVVARSSAPRRTERDLVLAEVALALGGLDVSPAPSIVVADAAQQRLDPGGAEDRVVDVVLVGRRQVAVAPCPRPPRRCRRRR